MKVQDKENKSAIAPLLVKLYDSHQLYALVKDTKPLARVELTRAVTDLFEADLSLKEQDLLSDIIMGLTKQAEIDLRQALSERLASYENVPLRLALHLANDDIKVAAPMLRKSSVLSDLDLIYIIKSQNAAYWQEIARREDISPQLIDVLADTKDVGTAVNLSSNERISLTKHAIGILKEMAKQHDEVAKPLIRRKEVPQALVSEIYQHVGSELKSYIQTFLKGDEAPVAIVEELVVDFTEQSRTLREEFMPSREMMKKALVKAQMNQLSVDVMLEALQKGQIADFIGLFSAYTGVSARKYTTF